MELSTDIGKAEQYLQLHNDSVMHMQNCVFEVLQRGQDLCGVFETSGVQIMADSQYDAPTRIQVLLEYLHERVLDLEDMADQKRIKLEQCVQLRHFEAESRQVIAWIRNGESMLTAGLVCPNNLKDAEQLKKEHEQFQMAIEVSEVLIFANFLKLYYRIYGLKIFLSCYKCFISYFEFSENTPGCCTSDAKS